jgi:hypothetical protein
MIAILISSLIFLFIASNIGIYTSSIMSFKSPSTDVVLFGIVILNTLISIISIFYPINIFVLIIFLCFSFIHTYFTKNTTFYFFKELIEKKVNIYILFFFLFLGLVIAGMPTQNFDTYFYHIQSIKWIEEYKAIPGLANLHGRFGFNSNIFLLNAFISLKDIFNKHIFSINYSFFIITIIYYTNKAYSTFYSNRSHNIFILYIISIFFLLVSLGNLSSPSPDYLSFIIPYYIFIRIIEESTLFNEKNINNLIPVMILAIYVLTIKLSSLPILLIPLCLFIKYYSNYKNWILFLLFSAFIFIPWLTRNIILTGWLVYPFPYIDIFDIDWKVPSNLVIIENLTVVGWARIQDHSLFLEVSKMNFIQWLPIWVTHTSKIKLLCILFSFLTPLFYFSFYLRKHFNYLIFSVIFTSFIGLIFWFFMAPDFRFGLPFILISIISPLLFLTFKFDYSKFYIIFKLTFSSMVIFVLFKNIFEFKHLKKEIIPSIFISQNLIRDTNLVFLTYKVGNLNVFYPNIGVQCYDHKLPCAPYLNNSFELRGSNIIQGFKYK